jgi:hypothetical protein
LVLQLQWFLFFLLWCNVHKNVVRIYGLVCDLCFGNVIFYSMHAVLPLAARLATIGYSFSS